MVHNDALLPDPGNDILHLREKDPARLMLEDLVRR